jgi:DNA-binding XRE family transcriptional regulator
MNTQTRTSIASPRRRKPVSNLMGSAFSVGPHDSLVSTDSTGSIGSVIRATRKAAGLTLVEAATFIGIAKQTLGDLERGRSSVGIHIVLKVLNDLGLGIWVAPKKEIELAQRTIFSTEKTST